MQLLPASPVKIIHADDHSLFRTGVRNGLSKKPGISYIGEAGNGQELLQLLEYLEPDIILLDIQMPVMDGLDALQVIKKKYPTIKVIILSIHNDSAVICRMIESGANGYLTSESGSDDIYKAIMACQSKWFYINNTVIDAFNNKRKALDKEQPVTFSEKEIAIARLLYEGLAIDAVAERVDLSRRTVEAIIERLYTKTGAKTWEALMEFVKNNFIAEGWPAGRR